VIEMKRAWRSGASLARLSLVRTLSPWTIAWCAGVLALLALREWAPATASLGAPSVAAARAIEHGLARQGVWDGALLAIVPFLVWRAARTVSAWRAGDVDWMGSRAVSRATILVATWLGAFVASLLVIAPIALIAEARAGASVPSVRLVGTFGEAGAGWAEGRRALTWRARDPLDALTSSARDASTERAVLERAADVLPRARFELALGSSSGPGASITLRARRMSSTGAAETHTVKRVGTRSAIEVDLPPGRGDVEFSLACADASDRVFLLSTRGELWSPVASDGAASTAILARMTLALAAWLALAIGFGAWMHATSAAAMLLALLVAVWCAPQTSTLASLVPGGDLLDALSIASRGRVPPAIDARSFAVCALIAAIGLSLARWSLAHWRRES
jgi:hypothetical protein